MKRKIRKSMKEMIENILKQQYRNEVNKKEEESEEAGQRKRLGVANIYKATY